MSLVYISDFYGIPYEEFSTVGFFFAHDHTEDGGLTRSIRAYYPYDSRLREYKVQVVVQELISESLAYMASFYHIGTQARSIRDIYFEFFFQLFLVFAEQAVIVLQAGFLLGLSSFRSLSHPFQLPFEYLLALAFCLLFLGKAFCLLVEPRGVITFPRNPFPTVKLQDPASNIVQEITVVSYGDHRTCILL